MKEKRLSKNQRITSKMKILEKKNKKGKQKNDQWKM